MNRICDLTRAAGFDPRAPVALLRALPRYLGDLRAFRQSDPALARTWPIRRRYQYVDQRRGGAGTARGHYFHQDLLVARRIFQRRPERHVDVGSRIDGFVAHVATFRPIEVLDIRAMTDQVPNVTFRQCDLMAPLAAELESCCDSLSCLHALEHLGLGRYGDPVRGDGHLVGLANLHRIVRPGGRLYLSVPMGPQRVEFNAQRVFALRHLLELVDPLFEVASFSFVDDAGELRENWPLSEGDVDANCRCNYGLAILDLVKRHGERAAPFERDQNDQGVGAARRAGQNESLAAATAAGVGNR